jgi:F-type H+-transporting ATPase subunit b
MPEFMRDSEFWVALGFLIFVVLVWKRGTKVVVGSLDDRAQRIRAQIAEAETLRSEAEAMLRQAEARQREVAGEVRSIVEQAKQEAVRLAEEGRQGLAALLKRREQQAVEKIAQAEATAVSEVRQAAIMLAIAATRRVLAAEVQGAVAERLVDQAIQQLPARLN